jgi:hypothetical protein
LGVRAIQERFCDQMIAALDRRLPVSYIELEQF